MKKLTIAALLGVSAATLAFAAAAQGGPRGAEHMPLDKIDTNGDGNITKDEITASKAERFANADANGDGGVTQAEFEAFAEAERAERQAARRDRMFARLDADGDGVITVAEHAAHANERMERRFAKVDTDGDGVITQAERDAARAERQTRRHHGRRANQQ